MKPNFIKNQTTRAAAVFLLAVTALTCLFSIGGIPASAAPSTAADSEPLYLYPGGMPFGVRFFTNGVLVVGFADEQNGRSDNPAVKAGIRVGDVITAVGGTPVEGAQHLTELISAGSGAEVTLTYRRGNKQSTCKLTPQAGSDGKYKTGIWVRDSGAGIGTVTFLCKNGCSFAGLGHGICDGDTGTLIPMRHGTVTGVTVSQIVRGQAGTPGEIKGYFGAEKLGALLGNTECGVYGILTDLPSTIPEGPLPVAQNTEVHDGPAYIWCTLDTNTVTKYQVEISHIDPKATGNKCFTVKITDKALLECSGGIVQGMSGSPIIQDGKIIGAVTHVLINDPTTGYGIFVHNMLNAMPDLLSDGGTVEQRPAA